MTKFQREVLAGVFTVLLIFGLIFGAMWVAPFGGWWMFASIGMLSGASVIGVMLPFIWW